MSNFLKTLDISASGLTAQRFRMDVVAQNIANAQTTRTEDGEPYRRRYVVFSERNASPFSRYFGTALSAVHGNGVDVTATGVDNSPFKLDYDPSHPDADEDGYVRMPNIDTAREMVDFMTATRAYEANLTILEAVKTMANKTLEIGR